MKKDGINYSIDKILDLGPEWMHIIILLTTVPIITAIIKAIPVIYNKHNRNIWITIIKIDIIEILQIIITVITEIIIDIIHDNRKYSISWKIL